MKFIPALTAALLVGLTSTPAFALFCVNEGPSAGFEIQSSNNPFRRGDDSLQKELDIARLRDIGVQAKSVERWNGCIRAFVVNPGGGQTMEFYDPATLRRLL